MLEIGSLVDGKYKVLSEIGHGGMSVVYLALNERANKTWAIKEVRKNGATNYDVVKQGLIAETNILKQLNHPRLPSIIDVIDDGDSFLIVMDYVEGSSLEKKLSRGPQPWKDVVEWSKQLCDVLAYLHSRPKPIIYRDMKPSNVMLKPNGDVVPLDFGTAREYKSQRAGDDTTCLGTRGYAAPEQYGGMGQTDARTDIYCLGATMYHLVTGQDPALPPYEIKPIRQIDPKLPKGLEQIILKCTRQDPQERYQSCAELMYDLEHIEQITGDYIRKQKAKLHRWIGCAALTVGFLVLGIGLHFASTRTIANSYNKYLRQAAASVSSAANEMSEGSGGYISVQGNLKKAIETNPSDERAWIYLTRLYRSDRQITHTENSEITKLMHQYQKNFERNNSGYAQFCMEWGRDLFFLYKNGEAEDGAMGSGDPTLAKTYLQRVVGENPDEKTMEKQKKLLENSHPDSGSFVASYKINEVSEEEAQAQYTMATHMLQISNSWDALGKSSVVGGENYNYTQLVADIKSLLDDEANLRGAANSDSNIDGAYTQCMLYEYALRILGTQMGDMNREGVTYDQLYQMVSSIETNTKSIQTSSEEVRGLVENITNELESVKSKLETIRDNG